MQVLHKALVLALLVEDAAGRDRRDLVVLVAGTWHSLEGHRACGRHCRSLSCCWLPYAAAGYLISILFQFFAKIT